MKKLFCILSMTAIAAQAIAAQSCSTLENIKGNKNIVSREIDISDYAEIYFSVPCEVTYLQTPDKAPYLQIATDENILPLLEIEVTGNRLSIKCSKQNTNLKPSRLTIHTSSSHLSKVEVAGWGKVHLKEKIKSGDMSISLAGWGEVASDDLSCEKIRLDISGSGKVALKGIGSEVSCKIAGSGNIDLSAYPAQNVDCGISGSGDVLVYAENKLTAKIAGSGKIRYKGNPPVTNIQVAGSGTVKSIK
ncbi:MAG: DUF2807 domain-containing protein [Prevotellaceae bacterium]|jgi:hypothetical protein|nr:DUF2807 domain-containing protein [Prevotellaceae bacterium]